MEILMGIARLSTSWEGFLALDLHQWHKHAQEVGTASGSIKKGTELTQILKL